MLIDTLPNLWLFQYSSKFYRTYIIITRNSPDFVNAIVCVRNIKSNLILLDNYWMNNSTNIFNLENVYFYFFQFLIANHCVIFLFMFDKSSESHTISWKCKTTETKLNTLLTLTIYFLIRVAIYFVHSISKYSLWYAYALLYTYNNICFAQCRAILCSEQCLYFVYTLYFYYFFSLRERLNFWRIQFWPNFSF